MTFVWNRWFTVFISAFLISSPALACTDFRLSAKDGTIVIGRSLEFAMDLQSALVSTPRDTTFTNTAPNGKPGLSWKNQYGYVFLDGLGTGMVVDGMNEAGLAIEALYLPGETQYQTVPAGKENHALAYLWFGNWVLGNFKTVDEVKNALATVYVYAQEIPQAKNYIFPLHFNITDMTGKSIVIEFTKGNVQVYDNTLGVMTNSPTYDWHITNLRNFINLNPVTPKPIIDNGMTVAAIGQGAGMLGLPGDISPPSRFVKVAVLLKTVFETQTADDTVNLAQHIINNVDIPLGFVRESQKIDTATTESTQWVVIKDLTHKMFYYRTYNDLALRGVDMTKVDFTPKATAHRMPIAAKQTIIDMTQQFNGTK